MDRLLFVDFQTGNWCEAPIPPKTLLPNYKVVSPVFPATRGETFQFTLRVFNIPSDPSSWAKQPLHLALRAKQKGRPNSNLLLYTNKQYSGSISVNEDADTGTWYFDLPASIVVSSQGINDLLKVSGPSGASVMEVPLDFEIRIYSDSASGEIDRLITSPSTLHVYNDLKRDNDSPDAPAMQGYPEPDLIFTKDQAEAWLEEYFRTHPIGVKSIGGETGDILLGTNLFMSGKTINATGGAVESVNGQTGKIILGLSLGQAGVAGQLSIAPNSNSGIELRGSKYVNSTTIEFTRVNNTTDNFILGTNLSLSGSTINSTGVSSIGGKTGIISLGNHLTISSGGLLNTNFGPLEYFEEYQSGTTYGIRLKGSIGSSATDITYGTDEFSIGLRYLNSNVTIYPKTNESAERYLAFYPDTSVDHEIRFQDVALYSELPNFTVTALGGQKGDILLGTNLSMSGKTINASGGSAGVTSIGGMTGAITLSSDIQAGGQMLSLNPSTVAFQNKANTFTQAQTFSDAIQFTNSGTATVQSIQLKENGFLSFAVGSTQSLIITSTGAMVFDKGAMVNASGGFSVGGTATFQGVSTFNGRLVANGNIENTTGIYYTPSRTPVRLGSVTSVADGTLHSWAYIDNLDSSISYSSRYFDSTGIERRTHVYLGDGNIISVRLRAGGFSADNKNITDVAPATLPTDAPNFSQLPDMSQYASLTGSNIFTGANTFSNSTTFNSQASFNAGMQNATGIYFSPTGVNVQMGNVVTTADGASHSWTMFYNGTNNLQAQVIGRGIGATGEVKDNDLYLGRTERVVIAGSTLMANGKKITNIAPATSPDEVPQFQQLPTNPITQANIATYAVTSLGDTKGDIALGTNLSMSGQTLNASGGEVPTNIITTDNIKNYAVTSVDEHKGDLLMSGAFSWMEDPDAPDLWYGQLVLPEDALTIENASSHVVTRINSATGDFTLGTNLSLSGHTINAASGGLRYFQEVLYPSSGGNVAMIQMKSDTDATDAAFGSYVAGIKFSAGTTATSEPAVNVVPWSMEENPGNKKLVLYAGETFVSGEDRIVEDIITTSNISSNMPSNVITTGNIANNAVTAINNVNGAFTTGTGLSSSGRVIRTNLINYPESFSISDSYNGSDMLFYVTQGRNATVNLGNSRTAVTGWMKYIDFRTGNANQIRLYVGNSENNSGYGGFRVDLQGTGSETAINSDGFKYNGKQVLTQ